MRPFRLLGLLRRRSSSRSRRKMDDHLSRRWDQCADGFRAARCDRQELSGPNRPGGKFYVAGRLDALMLANRHEPIMLRLNGPNGRTLRMMLTGYYLPDLPGSFFFALYLTGKDEFLNNADNPRRTRIRDRSDSIAWPARDDGGAKSISAGECEGRSGNDVESSIIQRSYPVDADLPCEDIPRRGAQVDLGQLRHDGNGF